MPKPLDRLITASHQSRALAGTGLATGLTGLGTAAGVAGATTSATWLTTTAIVVGTAVGAAGGLAVLGALGYVGYRYLFANKRENFLGKDLKTSDLDNPFWSCHITRVGVVGLKKAGKTEIKARLRGLPKGDPDTDETSAHLIHIDPSTNTFVALIDGEGAASKSREQQMVIIYQAHILIIVLDHNPDCDSASVLASRLDEHGRFIGTINNALRARYQSSKQTAETKVIFLLNKKDKWLEQMTPTGETMLDWFNEVVNRWDPAGVSVIEKPMPFSAWDSSDIDRLRAEIIELAAGGHG